MPVGTSTDIVRRLVAAVFPARVAHPSVPRIQAGIPAGTSNGGIAASSAG